MTGIFFFTNHIFVGCNDASTKHEKISETSSEISTTDPSIDIETCDEVKTRPKKLRRLTDLQYKKSVEQIFDLTIEKTSFPSTQKTKSFHTFSSNNNVTQSGSESILLAAEEVFTLWKETHHTMCSDLEDQNCLLEYLQQKTRLAYRRDLLDEEWQVYEDMFLHWGISPQEAMEFSLQTLLQSPQFLYIYPTPHEPIHDTMSTISPTERLALIHLFLHNTLPNQEQYDRYSDQLQSREDVYLVAKELLQEEDTAETIYLFHRDWLHLFRLYEGSKDVEAYPTYDEMWPFYAEQELRLFIEDIFWNGDARFDDLFFSQEAWIHPSLQHLYADSEQIEFENNNLWEYTAELSGTRIGVLTRPAFLMAHSYSATSSPVRRGSWVLEQMLCEQLNPPPDVDMEIPPPENEMQTIRDRLAIHSENPACQGCHQRIDPIGFSFEHYGAIGEYREIWENGIPVDASGSIYEGDFDHAAQMIDLIANHERSKTCYVQNWMEYALGRPLEDEDQCDLQRITQRFLATGGHVPSLIVDIASSDAFLYTRHAP